MRIFDGSQKSYVSEIVDANYRATALGAVATFTGVITLPSSLLAGAIWDRFGAPAYF